MPILQPLVEQFQALTMRRDGLVQALSMLCISLQHDATALLGSSNNMSVSQAERPYRLNVVGNV